MNKLILNLDIDGSEERPRMGSYLSVSSIGDTQIQSWRI
jgi:hypothetical protein